LTTLLGGADQGSNVAVGKALPHQSGHFRFCRRQTLSGPSNSSSGLANPRFAQPEALAPCLDADPQERRLQMLFQKCWS